MVFLDSNTIIYLSKELIEIETIFHDEDEYGKYSDPYRQT